MPRKKSFLTVTDQFCGAGGSSQGVRRWAQRNGGGIEVSMALNHWKLAIDTHNTNFPDTKHDCTDISACDPRRYPSTDILITSPECTTHSPAGGNTHKHLKKQMDLFDKGVIDPATERSRATMWDVVRFTEYHQYNIVIAENVVEAMTRWALFDTWLMAMHTLGYNHKLVFANSMHFYPTPQSRDRMYIVFWKKGNKAPDLDVKAPAYCPKCECDTISVQAWKNPLKRFGKYKKQYVFCCPTCSTVVEPYYYASFNCIDWTDRGTRIGDRKVPLRPNTVRRIKYGLDKYATQPFQVVNYTPGYTKGINDAFATLTCNDHHAVCSPFVVDSKQVTGIGFRVRPIDGTLNTIPTQPATGVVMPFIIKGEHTMANGMVKGISDPLQTQVCRQTMGLVVPFIDECNKTGECKPATEPTSTITAGGINHGIMTYEAMNSFIQSYYGGSACMSHVTEPAGTFTTKERHYLINNNAEQLAKVPDIEDCYYRMLKPVEVKLGMAFDRDYIILGSGKDQVKQSGNAVTPPVMEWLVGQCAKTLS